MNIANNILKYHLKNVYFLCGTACGGKTTISRALARKYGFTVYDEDESFETNKLIADPINQPAMSVDFPSWEYYFNRPYLEYHQWLMASMQEAIPMCLLELMKLSQAQKVIADMHMPVDLAMQIADFNQIAFLITEPEMVAKGYYLRPDHKDLYDCMMGLENPQKAFDNCSKTLEYGTRLFLKEIYRSGAFYLKRDENSTVENTLAQVERHFKLV